METAILINVRDRPTELALLLQSLRTQTYQRFDIFILDDMSGTPLGTYHFFNCILTRLKSEGHKVIIKRTEFIHGVSRARQTIADYAMQGDYKYFVRVDDDVVLEQDYLERLKNLMKDYDIASGITTPMIQPNLKRDPKFVGPIINRVILDKEGNYIFNGDDCGMEYSKSVVLPAHHFRSCAMMKREVHEKIKYYPTKLSTHGFREEQIFSFKALMQGFKIGVDTGAVNYHQLTPSGGERTTSQFTSFNEEVLKDFTKEHLEELNKLFPEEPKLDKELMKQTNCRI